MSGTHEGADSVDSGSEGQARVPDAGRPGGSSPVSVSRMTPTSTVAPAASASRC